LAEEMQAVSKGLEKVEQELATSENDGAISTGFRKVRNKKRWLIPECVILLFSKILLY